jgi:hypothetical protein
VAQDQVIDLVQAKLAQVTELVGLILGLAERLQQIAMKSHSHQGGVVADDDVVQ